MRRSTPVIQAVRCSTATARSSGIVTALLNPTSEDVFVGIGLAVPIDVAGGAAGLPRY